MKPLLLVSFTLLLFSACQKEAVEPVSNDLFPMAVGNTWVYERTSTINSDPAIVTQLIHEFTSQTVLSMHTYYTLSTMDRDAYDNVSHFRKGENDEYYVRGFDGTSILILKEGVEQSDCWTQSRPVCVLATNQQVVTPLATFSNVVRTESTWLVSTGGSQGDLVVTTIRDYQPSVGMVYSKKEWQFGNSAPHVVTELKLIDYTLQ